MLHLNHICWNRNFRLQKNEWVVHIVVVERALVHQAGMKSVIIHLTAEVEEETIAETGETSAKAVWLCN